MNYISVAAKTSVGENKVFFAISFVIAIVIVTFLTNFVSLPGLVYYQEILIPEGTGIDAPIFIVLFSFLLALSVTMHKYKLSRMKSFGLEGSAGLAGAIASIFTSACPICPPLILSFAGVSASIAVFPLGGWEMRLLSLVLMITSIHLVSKSLVNANICKVKKIRNVS